MPVFGLVGMVIGMNPPESVPWEHILYGVGFTAGSSTRGGVGAGGCLRLGRLYDIVENQQHVFSRVEM
jgi:hypothetical protein